MFKIVFASIPILLTWDKKEKQGEWYLFPLKKIHLSPYWFLLGEGEVTVGPGLVDGDSAALWKDNII